MLPTWERQPDEKAAAYEAFVQWRQLPLTDRHHRRNLARALGVPFNHAFQNRICRWARRYDWEGRAAAFATHQARLQDDYLAERRRRSQSRMLELIQYKVEQVDPEKLTLAQIMAMGRLESRMRRDDAVVPSVTRNADPARAAREFMGLDG